MRWPSLIFLILLLALQYPLWFGRGGWGHVRQLEGELSALREANDRTTQRNAEMAAEVKDLKSGYDAIEDKARFELGLVKPGEIFIQVPDEAGWRPVSGSRKREH